MELINPGRYIARIKNYGIPETDKLNPQIAVTFEFQDNNGHIRTLTWFGSTHPNAIDYTIDHLLYCGLVGNDLTALLAGPSSNALDMERELEITIETHEFNGKKSSRIKWINPVGGSKFRSMDAKKASTTLGKLSGNVAARRQEKGIKDSPRQADYDPNFDQTDDIGF